eukprot:2400641-Rhodomonas_salina.3
MPASDTAQDSITRCSGTGHGIARGGAATRRACSRRSRDHSRAGPPGSSIALVSTGQRIPDA